MWYILLTPRFIYKKEDFNTTRNENTYSEIVRMKKTSGKKGDVCKAENGSKQLSSDAQVYLFFLNVVLCWILHPVKNMFLSCT